MKTQRFSGETSREALRKVRAALGDDAIIMSNRSINGEVEIVAIAGNAPDAPDAPEAITVKPVPVAAPAAQQLEAAVPATTKEFNEVMQEIRFMRGLLETQLSEISWMTLNKNEPQRKLLLQEMLTAGFSPALSRHVAEKMPADLGDSARAAWLKSILMRNIVAAENENELLESGGTFALIGPTGVGKTTTTAKLAARCVMRHGSARLGLITTDGYRIGGHEQLRIYGKILGVMVHSVKDESDLRLALAEMKGKHTVLIDTMGVSQRDKMVAEQIALLSGNDNGVKRLLCLNATSTGETLGEVVEAYGGAAGITGCVLTKLDEATRIGNILDIVIRKKLRLCYVANGQRVPEDLHMANPAWLLDVALKPRAGDKSFHYRDDELPFVLASAMKTNVGEISLGQL